MALSGRQRRSLLLTAIAALGFAVIPLLHAEEHCREEQDDEDEIVAGTWEAAWIGPLDDHHHHQGHSHGAGAGARHGAGALAHLGVALHAPPQIPELAAAPPEHAPPAAVAAQLDGTLRYLVPEWSQGPPGSC